MKNTSSCQNVVCVNCEISSSMEPLSSLQIQLPICVRNGGLDDGLPFCHVARGPDEKYLPEHGTFSVVVVYIIYLFSIARFLSQLNFAFQVIRSFYFFGSIHIFHNFFFNFFWSLS